MRKASAAPYVLLAILIAAVIAFLLAQQYGFIAPKKAPAFQAELPSTANVASSSLSSACTEGSEARYCAGNVFVLEKCATGKPSTQSFNCTEYGDEANEAYCNPSYSYSNGITAANCDLRPRSKAPSPTATAVPTPSATVVPTAEAGFVAPFQTCPAGCDQETCDKDVELCGLEGYCGDGMCYAPDENSSNCCYDCACGANQFCEQLSASCYSKSKLTDQQVKSAVTKVFNASVAFIGDELYGGAPTKVAYVYVCSDQSCEQVYYVLDDLSVEAGPVITK